MWPTWLDVRVLFFTTRFKKLHYLIKIVLCPLRRYFLFKFSSCLVFTCYKVVSFQKSTHMIYIIFTWILNNPMPELLVNNAIKNCPCRSITVLLFMTLGHYVMFSSNVNKRFPLSSSRGITLHLSSALRRASRPYPVMLSPDASVKYSY